MVVKIVANSKSIISLTNLGTEQLTFNHMDKISNKEGTMGLETEARDTNDLDLLHRMIKINSRTNGVKEAMIEGKATQKKATIDRTRGTEERKDVTQTRVASLDRTLITIETQVGKIKIREEDPKTTVITTKASIAGIIKGTDVTTGDISEDINGEVV